ncbi:MAG: hypothetical protein HQ518_20235 [Rhodopirellula sp.]|nr:hypothetical protein [Rhodopirellula sp.]
MITTETADQFRRKNSATAVLIRLALVAVLFTLCGMLTGCSFDREWQASSCYSYPEQELAGCWEGTWQSEYNGHHGGLRAIITEQGDGYYDAHFHATYAAVIPFEFQLPLLVTDDGQAYALEGEADLGWLAGGLYTCKGNATATDFVAAYCAENKDHGTFTMQKVQTCSECFGSGTCAASGATCGACGR